MQQKITVMTGYTVRTEIFKQFISFYMSGVVCFIFQQEIKNSYTIGPEAFK